MTTHLRTRQLSFSILAILLALSTLLLITSLTLAKPTGTIIVNPGDSIQVAIDSATPGDTIVINAGTYTESLTLSKAVSLTGVNSTTVIIHAVPNQRVITVTGSTIDASVVISGLTFTGGNAEGGTDWDSCPTACGGGLLITDTAQPQMQNMLIAANHASAVGGGLYSDSPLTLIGVVFSNNSVNVAGGGAYINGTSNIDFSRFESNSCTTVGSWCMGGGLIAGKATIDHSYFLSNTTEGVSNGGGGVYTYHAAIVTDSVFEGNHTDSIGGGLFTSGVLTATNSVFKSNVSSGSGGGAHAVDGATIINSRFENNQATWYLSFGGGLASEDWLIATNTIFFGNVSHGRGGGVSAGWATISGGAFINNQSDTGGGLGSSNTFVTGTTFVDNVATNRGGGATAYRGSFVNALFSNNTAGNQGAALYLDPENVQISILNTTIVNFSLNSSSAIAVVGNPYYPNGTVEMTNTIIASHTVGLEQTNCNVYEDYSLFYGNVTNLIGGNISGGAHDVFGNPNFVDSANGDYHIAPPSAAIDTGTDVGVYTDLDGNVRPSGNGFDIGAYEVAIATVPISGLVAVNDSPTRLGEETLFVASVQAGDAISYRWDFGDGSAPDHYPTVAHTYPSTGIYTAIVTASNSLNTVTATTTVTVYVMPVAGLTVSNTSPTVLGQPTGLLAAISAGDFVSYTWNLGDGVSATGAITTHTYPAVGVYTASVTAFNSVNALTATTRITITDVPLSGLSASNNSPTPIGSVTTLTATISAGSNVTYTWNFGDGSSTGTGITSTHTYSTVGAYTATVTAVNSVSVVSATTRVTITDVPLSGLSASNSGPTPIGGTTTLTATISAGSNVTYTWDFGDGSPSAVGQVMTHTYSFSATSHFTATVTAVNSVSAQSASTTVVIVPKRVYLPLMIR